jgi:sugar lactone lactonase YvrE
MVDAQNVYWGNEKGIKMAPHGTGAVQTLVDAKDVGSVGHMWFDAKSVYWTDWKGGRVLRLAR